MPHHTAIRLIRVATTALSLALSASCWASAQAIAGATQIDLTAQSLTAAGLTEPEMAVLLTGLEECGSMLQQLIVVKISLNAATATASELAISLREGNADSQIQAQYLEANALVDQTRQQLEQIETSLTAIALEGLEATKAQRLINWRSTKDLRVPAEFRVLSLSLEELRGVETALRAEQRSIRLGEDVEEGIAALLASIRTNTEVIEADLRLETQVPTMQAFLQSWAGG